MRGEDEVETVLNLILEDRSRISAVFFLMNEDNVKTILRRPWVSLGSDGPSLAPEGAFLKSETHPRSYGNFARLLGKYVREEKIISLQEAIRRLTSLPATNLGLNQRGFLKEGMFADVVVFDPTAIADQANYEKSINMLSSKHVCLTARKFSGTANTPGLNRAGAIWGPGKNSQEGMMPLYNRLSDDFLS